MPDTTHIHNWEPLPRWSGRYRCSECKAFGYRAAAAAQDFIKGLNPSSIYAYKCKRCSGPAIGKTRHKLTGKTSTWYCIKHKPADSHEENDA